MLKHELQRVELMFHGVLTLLTRALKLDARSGRAHGFRIGSTLVIFLFLLEAHITSGGVGAPGLRFFTLISWLNLALITLAGSSFFATVITEEKEEGTLGLLQLAGVSTIGLLLGKSTSRLIAALLVFLTQLPFALLAISLGGVTAWQIVAVDVALAAYMVMLANVALLTSVAASRSGMAGGVMILFLLLLLAGVHFGDHSINTLVKAEYLRADAPIVVAAENVLSFLQRISIVTRIEDILSIEGVTSLVSLQVVLHLAVAVVAFGLAWLTFERFTRYADASNPARGAVPKIHSRWALFIERPWKRPLIWKDYHFLTGGHLLAIVKLVGYPLLLWLMYVNAELLRRVTLLPFESLSRSAMFVAIGCELCLYASRLYHEEVKWGTLPNLLMLPRSVASISAGKVVGCLLALLPALVTLCGLHVFLWRELARHTPGSTAEGWFAQTFDLLRFFRTSMVGDLTDPAVWMVLMQFLVLLHLTVLASLMVKWGGLALAVGMQLVLNALLAFPMSAVMAGLTRSYNADEVSIAPIIYVGCLVTFVLQVLIGLQVRQAAGR